MIFITRSIFSFKSKSLQTRKRLDQNNVHTEMIIAHQLNFSRLSYHDVEKQSLHLVLHQKITILTKQNEIETQLLKLNVKNQRNNRLLGLIPPPSTIPSLIEDPLAPSQIAFFLHPYP